VLDLAAFQQKEVHAVEGATAGSDLAKEPGAIL